MHSTDTSDKLLSSPIEWMTGGSKPYLVNKKYRTCFRLLRQDTPHHRSSRTYIHTPTRKRVNIFCLFSNAIFERPLIVQTQLQQHRNLGMYVLIVSPCKLFSNPAVSPKFGTYILNFSIVVQNGSGKIVSSLSGFFNSILSLSIWLFLNLELRPNLYSKSSFLSINIIRFSFKPQFLKRKQREVSNYI